jgi:hypothetical protein
MLALRLGASGLMPTANADITREGYTRAMLDSRAILLRAALGFLALEPREPEFQLLHGCFDTWRGIGDIVAGMARQDYDLELRRFDGRGCQGRARLS